ncbi:hypothetical protein ABN028_33655 [Actinopolymorpha sp. B17G11]|uniref:hypothetical protein n=1 Tax=Actinopolymorpha sp. B17G11 TaxID=3160861 RepID=UPI0032E3E842
MGTHYSLPGVDDSVLDTHHGSDVEFFARMRMSGALDVLPPSLTEAIKMSSVVLVGEIVDVRATEPVTGEVPTDKFYGVGLVVRPFETAQGSSCKGLTMYSVQHGEPELIDGMAEEARTYEKLSDLVAYLRTLDSVPVGTKIG